MSWIESRRPTHLVRLTLFSFQRSTSSEVFFRFIFGCRSNFYIISERQVIVNSFFKSFFDFVFSKSFSNSFIITCCLLFVKNFFEVFFDRIKLRKLFFFNNSVILSCHYQHVNNLFFIILSYWCSFEQIIIYQHHIRKSIRKCLFINISSLYDR